MKLVTGGAGFIGSNLARKLLQMGEEVIIIDNYDTTYDPSIKIKNIESLTSDRMHFINGDLRTIDLKKTLGIYDIDTVYHLAARAGVTPSIENPGLYHLTNVDTTFHVLEYMRKDDRAKKLVFASSSSVYGMAQYIPMDEKHPTKPLSPYGTTKLVDEKCVFNYDLTYGIEANCLRYFTAYGPCQRPEMMIAHWTRNMFEGRKIEIYGDQTRDFTYIDDIVSGTIAAAETKVHREAFNLGSGSRVPIIKVFSLIANELGLNEKDVKVEHKTIRVGENPDTHADIRKATLMLGYRPETTIEKGIKKYVAWFKDRYT
jgi:nucleoside-diphosphate-sugar epimerase